MAEIVYIHPDKIHPNPDNPRHEAGDVTGLARSIKIDTMLQPLMVINAPQFGPGHVMIEDGYRRWVAGKTLNIPLPCNVRTIEPDEDLRIRAIKTALITDLHKEHLSAMDRAVAYGRLRDDCGMTQRQIATMLHLNETTIGRYLSLLDLAPKHQEEIRSGKMPVERAIKVITEHRKRMRAKQGKKPVDVSWEPEHFTSKHPLAKKARVICDAREHTSRRRYDGVACGQCFEEAIRQDQTKVLQAAYLDAQREGVNPVFLPPFISADGKPREGVISNGTM